MSTERTSIGDVLEKVSRRIRDPVTTTSSTVDATSPDKVSLLDSASSSTAVEVRADSVSAFVGFS